MNYTDFWQFSVGNVEQFNAHPEYIILLALRHIMDDAWYTSAIFEHGNTLFRHIFTIELPTITKLLEAFRFFLIHFTTTLHVPTRLIIDLSVIKFQGC